MKNTKNRIRHAFNKAADTYDDHAKLHEMVCQSLLSQLPADISHACHRMADFFVADIGCGTGMSTQYLARQFPNARIYAVDWAFCLLQKARARRDSSNVCAIAADFDSPLFSEETMDLLFSNMSLQWSLQLPQTLKRLQDAIKPQGILALSVPVVGTFNQIAQAYRNPFFSAEEITETLNGMGMHCIHSEQKSIVTQHATALQALQSVKKIGANTLLKRPTIRRFSISDFFDPAFFKDNGPQSLTYEIGFFVASKS